MSLSSNRRIALNTIYMYVRLFVTAAIGLYTSRVVLLVLGISDYGLFNIVGGVIALFTFITGSLGISTSRFLNAEMGRANGDVNRIFNINLLLHLSYAVFFLLLAETIGLWYVYHQLVFPEGRLNDALFVYQISIFTCCIGLFSTPYSSLFVAKEKFGFQATLDIVNSLIRLFCVIALQKYSGNSLRAYTMIMSLTTVNSFVVYYYFAHKKWSDIVRFRLVHGWSNYKPVISFGSWNLLTTSSIMMRNTGSDLIVNSFFGTAINGVFAIGKIVFTQITSFSQNFDGVSAPQIIQNYNSGDKDRCYYIVNKVGRFDLLLFEVALFPIWIELEFLLKLWLKTVPSGVVILCKLNLIMASVALSCGGLIPLINASGKVKYFDAATSICYLLCLPLGYMMFLMGLPSYTILVLFIIADIFVRIIHLVLLSRILGFNSIRYVREAYSRPIVVAFFMCVFLFAYSYLDVHTAFCRIVAICCSFLLSSLCVFFLGLTASERLKFCKMVQSRFRTT